LAPSFYFKPTNINIIFAFILMRINGKPYHTIWVNNENSAVVQIIDQRKLPFLFEVLDMKTPEDCFEAIREMAVRGAPLIGVTAAYGMYLALHCSKGGNLEVYLNETATKLKSARPTAVNLAFAADEILDFMLRNLSNSKLKEISLAKVEELKSREISFSEKIGEFGLGIIEKIYQKKKKPVNILTHCNAGWLACIDWGTATAPIYKAHCKGIPVHVWVDETRPRNQGARLTAFELAQEGVHHTVIADNTGGHLMQHKMVDLIIVGSDRTTVTGDVANKIGTYLKALAAKDNGIPFYVALPSSTFDWKMENGMDEIPIEERNADEVTQIEGWNGDSIQQVRLIPENSTAANYGFDVTPARLVTGLITERGICKANKESILKLFPQKNRK
jgi:methylthioribose-1-phosphate isomerase